MDVMFHALPWY